MSFYRNRELKRFRPNPPDGGRGGRGGGEMFNGPSGGFGGRGGGSGFGGEGGGGAHRGRGGGGAGSGREMWGDQNRPPKLLVKINYFKLEGPGLFQLREEVERNWRKYNITIFDASRKKRLDSENQPIIENGRPVYFIAPFMRRARDAENGEGFEKTLDLERGSTPLSRRIIGKLLNRLNGDGHPIAADGSKVAIAPRPVFLQTGADQEVVNPRLERFEEAPTMGRYGPADQNVEHRGHQPRQEGIFFDYAVKVRKTCDDDEEDADLTSEGWYIVRLQEVKIVDMEPQELKTILEIVLKTPLLFSPLKDKGGRSPDMFYFDSLNLPGRQESILGRQLGQRFFNRENATSTSVPMVGISSTMQFCQGGNAFANIDVGLDWFNIPSLAPPPRNEPIPLVDEKRSTLCGIQVPDLRGPIKSEDLRRKIEQALKTIVINMKYAKPETDATRSADERFREELLREGKSSAEIEKKVSSRRRKQGTMVIKNQRYPTKIKDKVAIFWSADRSAASIGLDIHTFPFTPRARNGEDNELEAVEVTVADYFQQRYGITLRYPSLPIIYLVETKKKKEGYFPLEFCFQAFSKTRGQDNNQHVLKFNDEFASTERINHLQRIKEAAERIQAGQHLATLLGQFGVAIANGPVTLTAKVLQQPRVAFLQDMKVPRDGSWDLRDATFMQAGTLSSFAILDFCGEQSSFSDLLRSMQGHGITMPMNVDINQAVVALHTLVHGVANIGRALDEALNKCKGYFLHQVCENSQFSEARFFTNVVHHSTGEILPALVRPGSKDSGEFEAILPEKVFLTTHEITLANGRKGPARIKARIGSDLVDLFDLRWSPAGFERRIQETGRWQFVEFRNTYAFQLVGANASIDADEVRDKKPQVLVDKWQVDVPSIVLVQMEENNKETYNVVKLLTNIVEGVQSQCFILNRQKMSSQYWSNVALKVNTKIHSKASPSHAWDLDIGQIVGGSALEWIKQAPTMVMGISLSRAPGQDCKTAVVASVCLDGPSMQMAQDLRVQESSGIVERKTMEFLTKSLALQYFVHQAKLPTRCIIYRNGSSEGNFDHIMNVEFAAIKKAFYDLRVALRKDFSCQNPLCLQKGCVFCCPIITLIVAVSQHTIRVVPAQETRGRKGLLNVPSGTVVDDTVTSFLDEQNTAVPDTADFEKYDHEHQLFEGVEGNGFDFLLTSHGGLKGTSKPVLYRTVINENFAWRPRRGGGGDATPLTKDVIQNLTYAMTHQYGTATKAVRMVPVVKYSQRLAELAVSYIPYLMEDKAGRSDLRLRQINTKQTEQDPLFGYEGVGAAGDDNEEMRVTALMRRFTPFDERLTGENKWRVPFHPHTSA